MPPSNVVEFVSKAEREHMLGVVVLLPLARLIETGKIDPETVSRSKFFEAIDKLGKSHDSAYEIYVDECEEQISLIAHCISANAPSQAIVLLFTLIEGEINALLRMLFRIKGFTNSEISNALQGTDFETKINVMLPLLEVKVPARMRNTALQCKAIRNIVVHNKATPNLMSHEGDKASDTDNARLRASKFFAETPLKRIGKDLDKFTSDGLYESWAVQWATHLFDKFYKNSEA